MTEFIYDENEDFVRGRELRGKVLGSEYNERTTQVGAEDDFMGPLRQLSGEFVWGKIWSRPGLDIKTRRLINIVFRLLNPHYLPASAVHYVKWGAYKLPLVRSVATALSRAREAVCTMPIVGGILSGLFGRRARARPHEA